MLQLLCREVPQEGCGRQTCDQIPSVSCSLLTCPFLGFHVSLGWISALQSSGLVCADEVRTADHPTWCQESLSNWDDAWDDIDFRWVRTCEVNGAVDACQRWVVCRRPFMPLLTDQLAWRDTLTMFALCFSWERTYVSTADAHL